MTTFTVTLAGSLLLVNADSLHTLAPRCREREPSTSSALGR
jgi:hypothetical protein